MSRYSISPLINRSLPMAFGYQSMELSELTRRQHNAQKAHQRFLKTDIPIGLLGTAATYFWFANNDKLNIITRQFQQFVKNRELVVKTTDFLLKNANDPVSGRLLISRTSMGNIGLIDVGAKLAESPKRLSDALQRVVIENPSSYHVQMLRSYITQYTQAYQKIVGNPNALKTLMIPRITKLLRVTPYQAKYLAQNNPGQLMKNLFKQVYGSKVSQTTDFFTKTFSELARANVIRARMAAFGALVLFLGTFITRMELGMNAALNPQEAF